MNRPAGLDADAILSLDRMVHEPARLLILTVLSGAESVEFNFVKQVTGLTKGNLSGHAARLEAAGYIDIDKEFRRKIPVTSYRITSAGKKALETYWEQLRNLQPQTR